MRVVSLEFRDKSQLRVDAKENISETDPITKLLRRLLLWFTHNDKAGNTGVTFLGLLL